MLYSFVISTLLLCFQLTSSLEIGELQKSAGKEDDEPAPVVNSRAQREKRQDNFATNIPDEVKEEFKNYAKTYLNSMVTERSQKPPEKKNTMTSKHTRICAEVCQHRCLPSCEWSCCIKENIEEYRSAHLVKPLVTNREIQRKSNLASADDENLRNGVGKKRAHLVKLSVNGGEATNDGHECNPSCKRICLPTCRFACCQPVQIKGVLLF